MSASTPPPDPQPMPVDVASTLLELGVAGPRRPVDDLIDRLAMDDGTKWLLRTLAEKVVRELGDPRTLFTDPQTPLDLLRRIKERSKRLLREGERHDVLAGIAGYFLAIAAGLHHHGTMIGGRGREELDPILLDLATVTNDPWSSLLADATQVV